MWICVSEVKKCGLVLCARPEKHVCPACGGKMRHMTAAERLQSKSHQAGLLKKAAEEAKKREVQPSSQGEEPMLLLHN